MTTTRNIYDDIPLLIHRLDEARLLLDEIHGNHNVPLDRIDDLLGVVSERLSNEARRETERWRTLAGLVVAL